METLRRTIHPEVRIVDAKAGIVDYVASDETLDSYREVIRARGWRFDNFRKNSPFVDSHNYSSFEFLVGHVIDFGTRGRQLIERVKWAIDVPDNPRAKLGWKMTESGYLKAVSVGFWPEITVTRYDQDPTEYRKQLQELGLDKLPESKQPRAIYTQQQQIELSAVVIGANPNALLEKALRAGAITDEDVGLFHKKRGGSSVFQIPFSTGESKPKSSTSTDDVKSKILSTLGRIAESTSAKEVESQVLAPQTIGEIPNAARILALCSPSLRRDCELILADPEKRQWIRSAARVLGRANSALWDENDRRIAKSLTTGDSGLGAALSLPIPVAQDVYSLVLKYGVFRTFGIVPMATGKTKLASLTGKPTGYWITPANQGNAITESTSISGASITPEAAMVGALCTVSGELLSDDRVVFENALLEAFVAGLSYRIDWSCLQADGTADTTDGGMTGIFLNGSVPVANAAAGHTSVATLDPDDFASVIAAVTPSALQRPCRWWIAPDFLPSLLKIRSSGVPLLKPPTAPDGEWTIHGFPITWAAAAPNTDAISSPIAAFGRGDAYSVGLRQDFEIAASASGAGWATNSWLFRAIARAICTMRDATSLAILKTPAA
jgi:HK97 family phage major capsid protein